MDQAACQEIFRRVYGEVRRGPVPEIRVQFYPYADLNHTIRWRSGRLLVRLSDIVSDAPEEVVQAIARILLGRIMRKRVAPEFHALYRRYAASPDVEADVAQARAERGRPSRGQRHGSHYQLEPMFGRLNARYFSGKLSGVRLLWSPRRSFRRLGYYRQPFHTIVISRALDDPRVPDYVTEFILYHEMLHAAMPTVRRNGRRYDHTPAFREAERSYEHYRRAEQYLRRWPPRELKARRPPKGGPRQLWLF